MALFTPVRPVPAQAPQFGLVRSGITPADDGRWEAGFSWRPERCVVSRVYDPCDTDGLPASSGDGPGLDHYVPYAIRVEDECTTLSGDAELDEGRVRRQLEAVTSYRMARELWAGENSLANPYATPDSGGVANVVNRRLAQAAGVQQHAGIHQPMAGIGKLEELARRDVASASSDASQGQDVWLHLPIELLPLVDAYVVREGNRWFTKAGATVVFDAGYLGTDPTGAHVPDVRWMYATGPVQVRLGTISTATFIDQRTNRRAVVAERMAAASFDSCVHHGLAVGVPTTT